MLTEIASVLLETAKRWWSHDPGRLGAALAYYTIFSIGPLLLIVIAIAGLVLGRQAVEGQIVGSLSGMMGPAAANAIQGTLAGASDFGTSVLTLVIGVATLIASAVAIVIQLKASLNIVWGVEDKPEQGYWSILRHYVFALLGISLTILTVLFAAMFKFLPDAPVAWSDVWMGAAVTAILFLIGKWAIGWWIGRQGLDSTYGAAASVVVLLVWVYYASQILFFGAQFTRVWADRRGSRQTATTGVPASA